MKPTQYTIKGLNTEKGRKALTILFNRRIKEKIQLSPITHERLGGYVEGVADAYNELTGEEIKLDKEILNKVTAKTVMEDIMTDKKRLKEYKKKTMPVHKPI